MLLATAGVEASVLIGLMAGGTTASGAAVPTAGTPASRGVAHTTAPPEITVPPTTSVPVSTTVPSTTTTSPPPASAQGTTPTPPPLPTTTVPPAPAAQAPGYGCAAALAYLAAHAAPGFTVSCPGPDDGQQATTTAYFANGAVTGTIGIEVPCPAAYMNEAHNSWVLRAKYLGTPIPDGLGAVIDPFGYCHT